MYFPGAIRNNTLGIFFILCIFRWNMCIGIYIYDILCILVIMCQTQASRKKFVDASLKAVYRAHPPSGLTFSIYLSGELNLKQ